MFLFRFVEGLSMYGKNWKKVEEHVGTRNGAQIRSHAQKFFNRLEREFDKRQTEQTAKELGGTANTGVAGSANPQRKASYNFRKRLGSFDSAQSHGKMCI
jgi:SHAQKYF class myb-like DNA-binding protein